MRELQALEAAHPELVTPESPTQRVGGRPAEGFAAVAHAAPMLSLDNAYDEAELRAFDERVRRGLGAEAGRGLRGGTQDRRPEHRPHLRGRPPGARRHPRRRRAGRGRHDQRADHPRRAAGAARRRPPGGSRCAARSICRKDAFERINREREAAGEALFANPRNTAAGTMRNLDPAHVATRGLRAWTYHLVADAAVVPPRHDDLLRSLAEWGLPVEPHWRRCEGIDAVWAFCEAWAVTRKTLPFETDGVVVKLNDVADRAPARPHEQVPALGNRVQVPGRAGHDRAHGNPRQRRPDRRGDAVRRARRRCCWRARPSRWPRCTTPTTSPARTSARATR